MLQKAVTSSATLRISIYALLAILAGMGIFLLFNFNPEEVGFFPKCPSRALTGLDCPGCGSTRAIYHLLHLDIATAFARNPLLVLSIPVLVLMIRYPKIALHRSAPWISFFVVVLYGVLRNIDGYPFDLLGP